MMDILDKIDRLVEYGKPKAGGGSTLVNWELCDPKDDECQEIEVDIQWYWSPEERDVGYPGGLEIDGGAVIASPFTFMGKTYRAKQDFPKELRKYVIDFAIDPPSRMKSKYKGRDGWETFLVYQVEAKDYRW